MTPAAILTKALAGYDSFELGKLARDLGIPAPQVRRAAHGANGQSTNAEYHLKLCAWFGLDPVTGEPNGKPCRCVKYEFAMFAMAAKMARFLNTHTCKEAGKACGISGALYCRACCGESISFVVMLAICRYAALDPNNYAVPHETTTLNATGKTEARPAA